MYPPVRQLTRRSPELEHEPEPRTERRAAQEPGASTGQEHAPQPGGPSRYKLALLTWAGAYIVITAILATLGPTLASWPLAVRTLALSGLMVVALTWLIMPALARLCHSWLAPPA
jgi:antibiotic biosynthesis monooxygenase (ABM) superfamily enzyme